MKIKPVILCGGAGTRLWSQSKENLPKQFIDWGGWTLFGKTLERIKNSIFDSPIITTNLAYLNFVKSTTNHILRKYDIILFCEFLILQARRILEESQYTRYFSEF